MTEPASATLEEAAQRFADDLSATIQGVIGTDCGFAATALGNRLVVEQQPAEGIPLRTRGTVLLRLQVNFQCGWDGPERYLAVHASEFRVLAEGDRVPLFRYDFRKKPASSDVPSAHLQVHGHRDTLAHVMSNTGNQTARARRRGSRVAGVPRMEQLHFPLGGRRFRPSLEDLMQMLVEEFGVTAESGWRQRLEEGRRGWRRTQLQAAVRDDADAAADTLRELGYKVTEPDEGVPEPNQRHLRAP